MCARSIYSRLDVTKDEDKLTELFVATLERSPALARAIVELLTGIPRLEVGRIETQSTYGGDRPDIEIRASDASGAAILVLVEVKVRSGEGSRQLRRYAETLSGLVQRDGAAAGYLVYLTQAHDPKDGPAIVADIAERVGFQQHRWADVHRAIIRTLTTLDPEERVLARELARYLEDRNMTKPTTFTPEDLIGLARLPHLIRLLEHCLEGEVWKRFQEVAGKSGGHPTWASQLKHHDRYLYWVEQNGRWWIGIGFNMPSTDERYPETLVLIEVPHDDPAQAKLLAALDAFASSTPGWKQFGAGTRWPGICAVRSLRMFLHEADPVDAVRKWFVERFGEVDALRTKNPDLPWRALPSSAR